MNHFREPIYGYGSGADLLFAFYKQDIGDFLLLPHEWLKLKYGKDYDPANVTVISWCFPQTVENVESNRNETLYPSYGWAYNRTFGEKYNCEFAKNKEIEFNSRGIDAIAPMAHETFSWHTSEKYGYASNWSERHAAHICGLGTFGLCDGLISAAGKAVRYGSVIVAEKYPVTKRPYTKYNEYCIADKGCRACIDRCPAGAISLENGHDKDKCRQYQITKVTPYARETYGFDGTFGCGLCQCGVPCEHSIPNIPKLKFAPTDVDANREFLFAAHRETSRLTFGTAFDDEQIEREIERERNIGTSVFLDGEIVGVCDIETRNRDGEEFGWVHFFYLSPDLRGRGLGAQLIDHAVEYCREYGLDTLYLRVGKINDSARRFYLRNGFQHFSVRDTEREYTLKYDII